MYLIAVSLFAAINWIYRSWSAQSAQF